MPNSESAEYTVRISLMTQSGELPTPRDVEDLIATQMSGELDEDTGLFCAGVSLDEADYVFLGGNLSDGFQAFGPYASASEAAEAHDMEEGWIMSLQLGV